MNILARPACRIPPRICYHRPISTPRTRTTDEVAIEVLPAKPSDFDAIYPLLLDFRNPRMSRDDWRRMLFDLPWAVEEGHRGYMLADRGEIVGFFGTVFSRRWVAGAWRRFCATSSWIVREAHRGASLQLVTPILALKSHTIVNLTPSDAAYRIFVRLGLQNLETSQVLVPRFLNPAAILDLGGTVTTDPAEIRAALDEPGRRILDDMAGTLAAQILVRRGGRLCHVVATRSPWKGPFTLAYVQYASDWDVFHRSLGAVSAAFSRQLGTAGLRVDARRMRGARPRFSTLRPYEPPSLFRPESPEVTADAIDGLYTELVGQRW
jgi:hypothetical protein